MHRYVNEDLKARSTLNGRLSHSITVFLPKNSIILRNFHGFFQLTKCCQYVVPRSADINLTKKQNHNVGYISYKWLNLKLRNANAIGHFVRNTPRFQNELRKCMANNRSTALFHSTETNFSLPRSVLWEQCLACNLQQDVLINVLRCTHTSVIMGKQCGLYFLSLVGVKTLEASK